MSNGSSAHVHICTVKYSKSKRSIIFNATLHGIKSQISISMKSISFTLAMQPCENGGGESICIRYHPWMCIDCLSCAITPLFAEFIKIITAYGALIISIIPVACHGSSVSPLLFFKPYWEEYISHIMPCPQVAFQLERLRRIKKGSLKLCEIRKTRDEGNKIGEWDREEYCKVELSSLHIASAEPS